MRLLVPALIATLVLASVLAVFLTVPAATLGRALRLAGPALVIAAGGAIALAGRVDVGIGLAAMGAAWLARQRSVSGIQTATKRSTVRSAMFEMELDLDTGEMDGLILTGAREGTRLSALSEQELTEIRAAITDAESLALFEAYLDRRIPGWREDAEPHADAGQGGTPSSGPMTKQEAYQILGLEPGAGTQQIREAHRRLMKRVHPDSGGSTFLAAKINEAKDVLLD
jgi:DnaJ-domain-containing protein 1